MDDRLGENGKDQRTDHGGRHVGGITNQPVMRKVS